ncbi:23S rRNA (adenine(2503)-C(2))-methyltransferase RlmN [Duncaniella freteri]|jgi:23S rRNA (adenine2503-C2)-methyltransferase|uniref:23S rRNA (adenine(2503)-C(2))-methyltransferase RlmN n=1 Tax=Duncaniella freteri TaxID=2530391 RepID=UPI002557E2B3|nr:23S rRNA (adenine(2503)-C(2))-methyltransferase RlmN [Duncaniella freteri]
MDKVNDAVTGCKRPLLGMTLPELEAVVKEAGLRPFAAKQMARRLYVGRAKNIDEMTELPKSARLWFAERYTIGRSVPKLESRSADGTVKYLFATRGEGVDYLTHGEGGRDVEAVYIPDKDRATLCVSSQAGCRMGCRFCMTGRQGYHGDLSSAGIINQILSIPESESLTNIVFMGMGEPMDNVAEVLKAVEVLTAPWGLAWSPRRITVSSIGKLDGLRRLLDETKVHVAISVHSPFPSEREGLMPVERAYPAYKVMEAMKKYDFAHQRRLSAEYIMWKGVNDDMRHAEALARLLRGVDCRVNLIRFHAIPGFDGEPSDKDVMERFRDRLNSLGVIATIRASRGEDIEAACGMLSGEKSAEL